MSKIRLLYTGVDTLECTFHGVLSDELLERLDVAKLRAQALNKDVAFEVGSERFYMQPKGERYYKYVLCDWRMRVAIGNANPGLPPVKVKLRAGALASEGHRALYDQAVLIAATLGTPVEYTLSRIDLCSDVQGFRFTDADFENLVCPAEYKNITREGEGVLYRRGKGDVVFRLYRKDAELKAKKKLGYARVWDACGVYEPGKPVMRIEVQLRGNVLRELGARSVREAFDKLPALYTFGMEWCQLRVPKADETKKRWPVDARWKVIAALWSECTPAPRIRQARRLESEERALSRLSGVMATLAAYSGQRDLVEVFITALHGMEAQLKERDVDFASLVEEKVARLISKEGLSPP